jgi:hypothetical protein
MVLRAAEPNKKSKNQIQKWREPGDRFVTGQRNSPSKKLALVIALLAIAISAASLFRQFSGRGSVYNAARYQALGEVLAEEIAGRLNGKGNVLVVSWDQGGGETAPVKESIEAIGHAFREHSEISLLAEEGMTNEGKRQVMNQYGELVLPFSTFQRIISNHPDADLILSLAGAPAFTSEEWEKSSANWPDLACVLESGRDVSLIENRAIVAFAVAPRKQDVSPGEAPAQSARERFGRHYEIHVP